MFDINAMGILYKLSALCAVSGVILASVAFAISSLSSSFEEKRREAIEKCRSAIGKHQEDQHIAHELKRRLDLLERYQKVENRISRASFSLTNVDREAQQDLQTARYFHKLAWTSLEIQPGYILNNQAAANCLDLAEVKLAAIDRFLKTIPRDEF